MSSKIIISLLFVSNIILGQKNRSDISPTRIMLNKTEKLATSIADIWKTSNYYDYQGIRFIIIISNDHEQLQKQAEWMDSIFTNPCQWTITSSLHHIYLACTDRDDNKIRNTFSPVLTNIVLI